MKQYPLTRKNTLQTYKQKSMRSIMFPKIIQQTLIRIFYHVWKKIQNKEKLSKLKIKKKNSMKLAYSLDTWIYSTPLFIPLPVFHVFLL